MPEFPVIAFPVRAIVGSSPVTEFYPARRAGVFRVPASSQFVSIQAEFAMATRHDQFLAVPPVAGHRLPAQVLSAPHACEQASGDLWNQWLCFHSLRKSSLRAHAEQSGHNHQKNTHDSKWSHRSSSKFKSGRKSRTRHGVPKRRPRGLHLRHLMQKRRFIHPPSNEHP